MLNPFDPASSALSATAAPRGAERRPTTPPAPGALPREDGFDAVLRDADRPRDSRIERDNLPDRDPPRRTDARAGHEPRRDARAVTEGAAPREDARQDDAALTAKAARETDTGAQDGATVPVTTGDAPGETATQAAAAPVQPSETEAATLIEAAAEQAADAEAVATAALEGKSQGAADQAAVDQATATESPAGEDIAGGDPAPPEGATLQDAAAPTAPEAGPAPTLAGGTVAGLIAPAEAGEGAESAQDALAIAPGKAKATSVPQVPRPATGEEGAAQASETPSAEQKPHSFRPFGEGAGQAHPRSAFLEALSNSRASLKAVIAKDVLAGDILARETLESRAPLPGDLLAGPASSSETKSAVANAGGAQASVPHSRPTPIPALAVEVGMHVLKGETRFAIRLDPAELGKVDVTLSISEDGQVEASLVVDRVETLALLKREASTLEQAFEQAGLRNSDQGLQFSLRGEGGQGEPGRNEAGTARAGKDETEIAPEMLALQRRVHLPSSRIDLIV